MNTYQKSRAQTIFEKFQKKDISSSDLDNAEKKAENLKDQMGNFRLLIDMIKDTWDGKFSISKTDMAIIVGAILYVISPIDAIPDFIPVLGWIDDIAVVGWAMNSLSKVIADYKRQVEFD